MSTQSLSEQATKKQGSNHPDIDGLREDAGEPQSQALNAEIPKNLHKRAKRYGLENDLYLREVLIRALRGFLPD